MQGWLWPSRVQTYRAISCPSDRELAKAEKLSLEEGGKDTRGLLSGLRRRKRPLSWRGHRDGPQHPDPDPCTQTSMHTSGALPQDRQLEMDPGVLLAHPKLLFYRFPQLSILGTICGSGPRGRHPQCPGSHQHCVSKGDWHGLAPWLCDVDHVLGLSGSLLLLGCGFNPEQGLHIGICPAEFPHAAPFVLEKSFLLG